MFQTSKDKSVRKLFPEMSVDIIIAVIGLGPLGVRLFHMAAADRLSVGIVGNRNCRRFHKAAGQCRLRLDDMGARTGQIVIHIRNQI